MNEINDKLNDLLNRIESIEKNQANINNEIQAIKNEALNLQLNYVEDFAENLDFIENKDDNYNLEIDSQPNVVIEESELLQEEAIQPVNNQPVNNQPVNNQPVNNEVVENSYKSSKKSSPNFDLEKYIGENLISKIGILITIIGVAIGAKYSIDNNLISPLVRIIFGYVSGLVLFGFAYKLKAKYEKFSAALLSGSMAVMYFITYSAYSLYSLMPQYIAFILMVVFTVFTVVASIKYNMQIIAHIGLVGAYAVPFLLSKNSGQAAILFTYMTMINIGILTLSLKKLWNSLYYSATSFSWFIYISWLSISFNQTQHFEIAILFGAIFFIIFFGSLLFYKNNTSEPLNDIDISFIILNGAIFYISGSIVVLNRYSSGDAWGVFTIFNALVYSLIAILAYKRMNTNLRLYWLNSGIAFFFMIIAVPIIFDFKWITIIWSCYFVILFGYARFRKQLLFEKYSYIVYTITLFFLAINWLLYYNEIEKQYSVFENTPIFNFYFLANIVFLASVGILIFINRIKPIIQENRKVKNIQLIKISIVLSVVLVSFIMLSSELELYFMQKYYSEKIANLATLAKIDESLINFKIIWQINYSMLFIAVLSYINLKVLKNKLILNLSQFSMVFVLVLFLTSGLSNIEILHSAYLSQFSQSNATSEFFGDGLSKVLIKYISLFFITISSYQIFKSFNSNETNLISNNNVVKYGKITISSLVIALIYLVFRSEIELSFMRVYLGSTFYVTAENVGFQIAYRSENILNFKDLWQIYYSFAFVIVLSYLNFKKLKNQILYFFNIGAISLLLLIFISIGLYYYNVLQHEYISKYIDGNFLNNISLIYIRYIGLIFALLGIKTLLIHRKNNIMNEEYKIILDVCLYVYYLVLLSSEYIYWLNFFNSDYSFKLGLSILWSAYALYLLFYGILKNIKYFRILSIVIFSFALSKLFLYDIAHLGTISKTIIFVSLGILLLCASFLYNKYKQKIFNNSEITNNEN